MKRFLVFILIIFHTLQAEDNVRQQNLDANLPLAIQECGPDAMVNGCVNVITREFIDSVNLINVAAPQPIQWQAYYTSSMGWRFNHDTVASFKKEGKGKKYKNNCFYCDPGKIFQI